LPLQNGPLRGSAFGRDEYGPPLHLFDLPDARRGGGSADLGGVRIISGEHALTEYRFNTKTAKHYFCSICGIYTHHQRRSNPGQFGVNAACIEGMSPFDFTEVPVNDGVHHPSDIGPGSESRLAGLLRYQATEDDGTLRPHLAKLSSQPEMPFDEPHV
jgi:hypothetical protein